MTFGQFPIFQGANYKWWAFCAIAVGLFTSVADAGSVVVALPTIADHFGTDLPTAQWVVTGYALTISAFLLPMGRLSDVVGRKRIYVLGFLVFAGGAAIASVSASVILLILSRVVMGVGSAMTQGTSMAMVVAAFPGEERGKALGFQMSVVGAGAVAGPAVGGIIVSALGWSGVFLVTGLMGMLAVVVAQVVLRGGRPQRTAGAPRFDWLGAALSAGVMTTFLLGMSNGPRMGWGAPLVAGSFLAAVALLGAFVLWELRARAPLLDVRLFQRTLFSLGVSAGFISFTSMISVRFLMPFYLQSVLGYSPRAVGLMTMPAALAMVVVGPLSGRLSDRHGWRTFNVGGLALSAAGIFLLSVLTGSSSLWLIIVAMVVQSIGTGMFNAPNNSSVLSVVEPSRYGVVSGFLNVVRNSANVTGIALATAVVTAVMASHGFPPSLAAVSDSSGAGVLTVFTSGLRLAYLVMGGLTVLGMVLSLAKSNRPVERRPAAVETAAARKGPPA